MNLLREKGVDVRDMPISEFLVATAAMAVWKTLVAPEEFLETDSSIELLPETAFEPLAGKLVSWARVLHRWAQGSASGSRRHPASGESEELGSRAPVTLQIAPR